MLHVSEKDIGFYGLGHKIGREHSLGHDRLSGLVPQSEVVLGVQDAHDVIDGVLADRIAGVAVEVDGVVPVVHGVFHPKDMKVGSMGSDLFGGQVIKLEDVLDELLFLLVYSTLLAAYIHHHADLFLTDGIVLSIGINAQQAKDAVGGDGQEPDDGGEGGGDAGDEAGHPQGQGFSLAHSHPLGDQLAED